MVFNSYIFIFALLPLCLIGYFGLNHFHKYNISKCFLIGISLWFYGYFHISYLVLIILSVLANYSSYRLSLLYSRYKKLICGITVSLNLLVLFIFKYYDFFISNINSVFKTDIALLNILLPLGISFFTFQQIAFTIDISKDKAFSYSFIDYMLFVCFFPQLVAGPIVNHDELIPQINDTNNKQFNYENFSKGVYAFILGLSKKVLLADVFALAVNYGLTIVNELNTPSALFIIIAFTFQLYFDFSGYSDMARGLALMMNYHLPLNFNSPFKSTNIGEFWKNWHMTLNRFFTTYVYIPLGGNRKGAIRTYINIFIIFLLSGIWHGASWTFVIWGIINGIGVVIIRFIMKTFNLKPVRNRLLKLFHELLTFIFYALSLIFFVSPSLQEATGFIKALTSFNFKWGIYPNIMSQFKTIESVLALRLTFLDDLSFSFMLPGLIYMAIAAIIIFFCKNVNEMISDFKPKFSNMFFTALLFLMCVISFSGISTFIYYNF